MARFIYHPSFLPKWDSFLAAAKYVCKIIRDKWLTRRSHTNGYRWQKTSKTNCWREFVNWEKFSWSLRHFLNRTNLSNSALTPFHRHVWVYTVQMLRDSHSRSISHQRSLRDGIELIRLEIYLNISSLGVLNSDENWRIFKHETDIRFSLISGLVHMCGY